MNFSISFKSLDARRLSQGKGQVNINNNSTITSVAVEGEKMNVGFVFSSNYEPNVAFVRIEGDLEVMGDEKTLSDAMMEWEKTERSSLPKDMAEKVHNSILTNCIVEACILARDLKLPAPIPMPHIGGQKPDCVSESDTSYIR